MNSLFPEATAADIKMTKRLLDKEYKRIRAIVADYEQRQGNEGQRLAYEAAIRKKVEIERAINLILDSEAKEIVKFRYMDGHKNAVTIHHFVKKLGRDERTIARRLEDGIESVANTLLLWEESKKCQ